MRLSNDDGANSSLLASGGNDNKAFIWDLRGSARGRGSSPYGTGSGALEHTRTGPTSSSVDAGVAAGGDLGETPLYGFTQRFSNAFPQDLMLIRCSRGSEGSLRTSFSSSLVAQIDHPTPNSIPPSFCRDSSTSPVTSTSRDEWQRGSCQGSCLGPPCSRDSGDRGRYAG